MMYSYLKSLLTFCMLICIFISCDKEPSDLRDNYTGNFSSNVAYHYESNSSISGFTEIDSMYAETVIVELQSDDSLKIISTTFGVHIIPFIEEQLYMESFGSAGAFTIQFASGGDSLYIYSHSYSGISSENYTQVDLSLAGEKY